MHLSSTALWAACILGGLSSASRMLTSNTHKNDGLLLAPRNLVPAFNLPEPSSGIYLSYGWPKNVVPERVEGFTTGHIPDFIASDKPQASRIGAVIVVYAVVKESKVSARDSQIVHTLGLALVIYANDDPSGWQKQIGAFHEALGDGLQKATAVAWRKIGYASGNTRTLGDALKQMPAIKSTPRTAAEMQNLRRQWLLDAMAVLKSQPSIIKMESEL